MVVFVCCLVGELVYLYVFIVQLLVLVFAWWGLVIPTGGLFGLTFGHGWRVCGCLWVCFVAAVGRCVDIVLCG